MEFSNVITIFEMLFMFYHLEQKYLHSRKKKTKTKTKKTVNALQVRVFSINHQETTVNIGRVQPHFNNAEASMLSFVKFSRKFK